MFFKKKKKVITSDNSKLALDSIVLERDRYRDALLEIREKHYYNHTTPEANMVIEKINLIITRAFNF